MLRNKANVALGLVLIIGGFYLLQVTFGFEGEKDDRLFPQILLSILMALGAAIILAELRFGKVTRAPKKPQPMQLPQRQAAAFVLTVGYFVLAFLLGFFTTTFLFLALVPGLFVWTSGPTKPARQPWVKNVAYAAAVTLFLYLSFGVLLKFSLPAGMLI